MAEASQPRRVIDGFLENRPSNADLAQRYALVIAWAAVIALFSILETDLFPTVANFATIFGSQAVLVMLTLALIIPLTAGDYDLSIASNLTLCAMVTAILNVDYGLPIGFAILAAIGVGTLVGAINGGIVVLFDMDSLIVTLGTGTFIVGVVIWISDSRTISGISDTLVDAVIRTKFLAIPLSFYYAVALCIIIWYVWEFTPLGRRLLFVGRGRNVARLSGINVRRLRWGAFVASGLITGIAGVTAVGISGAANPTLGASFLLPAFAAAFLGGTTIRPGRFNPWGSIIAVYFLITGITGLQLLGVKSFVQELFFGGALVIGVILSQVTQRRMAARANTSS
jgi:ribose transport system permease protein